MDKPWISIGIPYVVGYDLTTPIMACTLYECRTMQSAKVCMAMLSQHERDVAVTFKNRKTTLVALKRCNKDDNLYISSVDVGTDIQTWLIPSFNSLIDE